MWDEKGIIEKAREAAGHSLAGFVGSRRKGRRRCSGFLKFEGGWWSAEGVSRDGIRSFKAG